MRRPIDLIKIVVLVSVVGLIQSCGSSAPDKYRVNWVKWQGDSIALQIVDKAETPSPVRELETEFECLNCNLYLEPWTLDLDENGEAHFVIPEARQMLTPRIAVRASGIDTFAAVFQPPPEEATKEYHLAKPLTGRVLLLGKAILYVDSSYDSVATSASLQDEINIYSESPDHYIVHHPLFDHPLYMRKTGVVRVR